MEITIISAENLCMNGKPIKNDAYVVVHTQSRTKFFTTRMQTQEQEGGSKSNNNNPSWNEKFTVDHGDGANCITMEVQCKTWLGVRTVGAARVAVADFFINNNLAGGFAAAAAAEKSLQFLSYRLWDGKGRRNGVINFSGRVLKEYLLPAESQSSLCSLHEVVVEATRTMVEIQNRNFRGFGNYHYHDDSRGIVTGIPVFWNYPLNIHPR